MSEIEGHCEVCKELCKQKCSQCKQVYYCSAEHQKDDWKNHRKDCVFYEVFKCGFNFILRFYD